MVMQDVSCFVQMLQWQSDQGEAALNLPSVDLALVLIWPLLSQVFC